MTQKCKFVTLTSEMDLIKLLYKSGINTGQGVFSYTDITSIANQTNDQKIRSSLKFLVKKGDLIRISKGFYAFDSNFSIEEYANKLRVPSYVSLYTVLFEKGIVFQPYESIYLLSKRSEVKRIRDTKIIYRNIKDDYLLNPRGLS